MDPATYINEPSGSPETYSMWCEGFDLDSKKGEVSDLLVSKVEVRGLYTKLVSVLLKNVMDRPVGVLCYVDRLVGVFCWLDSQCTL